MFEIIVCKFITIGHHEMFGKKSNSKSVDLMKKLHSEDDIWEYDIYNTGSNSLGRKFKLFPISWHGLG